MIKLIILLCSTGLAVPADQPAVQVNVVRNSNGPVGVPIGKE
jgi:hypothetical protein